MIIIIGLIFFILLYYSLKASSIPHLPQIDKYDMYHVEYTEEQLEDMRKKNIKDHANK